MARQPEVKVKFSIFNKEFNEGIAKISKESATLRKEFKLQEEQLKANGTTSERFEAKLSHLTKQHQLAGDKVKATASQLAKAKAAYGENSNEARKLNDVLLGYQTTQQKLENQLTSTKNEQMRYKKAMQDVKRIMEVTETSTEDLAQALGPEIAQAIDKGTASTKQLENAFRKVSKSVVGTEADIHQVKKVLAKLDDGSSIKSIRKDLDKLGKSADEAKGSVKGLGSEIGGLAGGLAAGLGIGTAIGQSIDAADLKAKIDLTFEVPESAKTDIYKLVRNVESYGVDAEAALEGVRKQWALNKKASDTTNEAVIKGAATITKLYSGIDFNELIQETNEIGAALKISNNEALGLVDALLQGGFPPEQLDIIAEYGTQLQLAGYKAEEIQNIFAAGVDLKSWNIDNLLDGIKEGRIKMAEFGAGTDKATRQIIEGAGLSIDKFEEWGAAITKGGDEGQVAMLEATKALMGVKDETARNELGVKMFGTMWEDQGSKIADTLLNAKDGTADLAKQQENLANKVKKIDDTPAKKLSEATQKLKGALDPLFTVIANVVTKIASWAADNPTLTSTIVAIVAVVGTLLGILAVLGPIFAAIGTIAGVVGASIGAVAGVVGIVIAAIAALIAIGVLLYKNWDTIVEYAKNTWTLIGAIFKMAKDKIVTLIVNLYTSTVAKFQSLLNKVKGIAEMLRSFVVQKFVGMVTTVVSRIVNFHKSLIDKFKSLLSNISKTAESIRSYVINKFVGMVSSVVSKVSGFTSSVVSKFKSLYKSASGVAESIRSYVVNKFSGLKTSVVSKISSLSDSVSSKFDKIKKFITDPISSAKQTILDAIDRIKNAFSDLKLKIPKPSIPKISISSGIKNIAGFNVKYPKISWHKTGGVFTKPVVAGNAGFGDVEEGIVPFEGPHAKRIATLIADAQNRIQQTSKNVADKAQELMVQLQISAGDVIIDGKKTGEVVWEPVQKHTAQRKKADSRRFKARIK